jgi:hypothetical protein
MAATTIPPPSNRKMFAIMGQSNTDRIGQVIKEKYPDDHYVLVPGQWLLVADGTAKSISDNLGITDGSTGSAVIVVFTSYFGRANTQIWDWLAAKMGAPVRA